jgi:hypothetical protein
MIAEFFRFWRTRMSKTKILYHFTGLISLPPVLRDGIKKGEVPVDPRKPRNAANLTTNSDPERNKHWNAGGAIDKTKVRITVEMPVKSIISWREVREKFKVDPKWAKALDPHGEGKNWWFAFNGVSPTQFRKLEIRDEEGVYQEWSGDKLDELVSRIAAEHSRAMEAAERKVVNGIPVVVVGETWLMDGQSPKGKPEKELANTIRKIAGLEQ